MVKKGFRDLEFLDAAAIILNTLKSLLLCLPRGTQIQELVGKVIWHEYFSSLSYTEISREK